MLKYLALDRVGPAPSLRFDFDPRLNVLTGDNGLGKTFILDIAWWVLTGTWAGPPAATFGGESHFWAAERPLTEPHRLHKVVAPTRSTISWGFERRGSVRRGDAELVAGHSPGGWSRPDAYVESDNVIIYARVDGGFSVWEPIRLVPLPEGAPPGALHFSAQEIWDGKPLDAPRKLCEGIIRDWHDWQQSRDPSNFDFLTELLELLSPDPTERIRPGAEARRIAVDDVRKIPMLALPYGEVPITLASAGMRRVLSLTYLLVWVALRHREAMTLYGVPASTRMVLLIDEVEAHLHPRWQRVIVPAILKAIERVQVGMDVQVLMTTHSPMVLASLEPLFEEARDQLFNFRIDQGTVKVDRIDWEKHGDATGWLESPVFGLGEARSKEAEAQLERARAFLRGRGGTPDEALAIQQALADLVPSLDPFWAVWSFGLRHKKIAVSG